MPWAEAGGITCSPRQLAHPPAPPPPRRGLGGKSPNKLVKPRNCAEIIIMDTAQDGEFRVPRYTGTKGALKSTIFGFVLVITNWHWSKSVKTPNSSTEIHISGAGLWILVCAILLLYFVPRTYKMLRRLLDTGARVPRRASLVSWEPLLMLLPLFIFLSGSVTTSAGNVTTTITSGYGSDASAPLAIIAAILILVFQVHTRLVDYCRPG